jgi:hypothetical protein
MIYGAISVYVCVTTGRRRQAVSTWLVLDRADSDRLCHYGPESTSHINLVGTGPGRLGPSVSLRARVDQPYQLGWYWTGTTRTVCVTTCRSRPAVSTWLVLAWADSDHCRGGRRDQLHWSQIGPTRISRLDSRRRQSDTGGARLPR